jgi:hypothetical protein
MSAMLRDPQALRRVIGEYGRLRRLEGCTPQARGQRFNALIADARMPVYVSQARGGYTLASVVARFAGEGEHPAQPAAGLDALIQHARAAPLLTPPQVPQPGRAVKPLRARIIHSRAPSPATPLTKLVMQIGGYVRAPVSLMM